MKKNYYQIHKNKNKRKKVLNDVYILIEHYPYALKQRLYNYFKRTNQL